MGDWSDFEDGAYRERDLDDLVRVIEVLAHKSVAGVLPLVGVLQDEVALGDDIVELRRRRVVGLIVPAPAECCWVILTDGTSERMCSLVGAQLTVGEELAAESWDWEAALGLELEGGMA